jgi:tRNA pseudouridine38-40 synthase
VEKALSRLNWRGHSILAAGRTDAGVHATGQVLAVDLDWSHSVEDLKNALNAYLPREIAVRDVKIAPADFHPRLDAVMRKYEYYIICQEQRDPLRERFAWRLWPHPDYSLLQEASRLILGDHDFAAFGTPPHPQGRTLLTISHVEWLQEDDRLVFEIASKAFLYQMVRRLVAIQVSIGQKKQDIKELRLRLNLSKNEMDGGRTLFHMVAPPQGLILSEVNYNCQFTT